MAEDNSDSVQLKGKEQTKPKAPGRPGGFELTELATEGLIAQLAYMSFSDIADALDCSVDRARVICRKPTKGSKPARVSSKVIVNIANLLLMDCNKVAKDLDGPIAERRRKHLPTVFERLEAGAVLRAYDQGITPLFDFSELPAELALKSQPLLQALSDYEKKFPSEPFLRREANPWGRSIAQTEAFLRARDNVSKILEGLTELDLYSGQVVEFSVRALLDRYHVLLDSTIGPHGEPEDWIATCRPAGVRRERGFVIRSFPSKGEAPPVRFHQVYSGFNYAELKKEVMRKFTDWSEEEIRGQSVPFFVDGQSLVCWSEEHALKLTGVFGRGVNPDGPDDEQYVEWWDDDDE